MASSSGIAPPPRVMVSTRVGSLVSVAVGTVLFLAIVGLVSKGLRWMFQGPLRSFGTKPRRACDQRIGTGRAGRCRSLDAVPPQSWPVVSRSRFMAGSAFARMDVCRSDDRILRVGCFHVCVAGPTGDD